MKVYHGSYTSMDFEKSEKDASEIFYSSATFTQIADTTTQLYLKPWQEIYKLLQAELTATVNTKNNKFYDKI
jgi:hypothetical protein